MLPDVVLSTETQVVTVSLLTFSIQINIKVRSERCNIRVGGEAEEHCDEVRGREHGACTE